MTTCNRCNGTGVTFKGELKGSGKQFRGIKVSIPCPKCAGKNKCPKCGRRKRTKNHKCR